MLLYERLCFCLNVGLFIVLSVPKMSGSFTSYIVRIICIRIAQVLYTCVSFDLVVVHILHEVVAYAASIVFRWINGGNSSAQAQFSVLSAAVISKFAWNMADVNEYRCVM
jgi:hypothetical protein